jgi:calcium permeable stress-gated cation channel
LSGFLSTLIPALIVAGAMMLGFIILRRRYFRNYAPRTYMPTLRDYERTPNSPTGLVNWIASMYTLPDTYVLQHHSLDAYLLLRYMKLLVVMCFVGCCITWPILFPINATGGAGGQQFNILAMANVENKAKYFAHALVAWIFFGFVFYLVTRESIFYINLRQAYAFSPAYANRISSRTVLFSSVPQDYLDEKKLRRMFGIERVKNVWLSTNTADLDQKVKDRDGAAMKLEGAETKLIKMANAARLKAIKKGQTVEDEQLDVAAADTESGSVAARWVKAKDRPTHRLKFLIGKKVDTINWARAEIERLNPEIAEEQAKHRAGDAKKVSAVFVEFYNQNDAQDAYQSVAHNAPLHMAPRYIGVNPTQVIWSNLRIMWWERVIRNFATIAFICVLIIFWTIPVAFVGSISNIDSLIQKLPWLDFILSIPTAIRGVITGLLPSVLLSVLMALLPIIIRRTCIHPLPS